MIELVPTLESVIGQQQAVEMLGTLENQQRYNLMFQNFINVIATEEHPLVLFLDDLQWIDFSSLSLLDKLACSKRNKYFMLIGSYRENEVSIDHPVMGLIDSIKQENIEIKQINLTPLSPQDVESFLIDTLRTSQENVKELSEICYEKTRGNPFFLNQFLKNLHEDGWIRFDHSFGIWTWNTEDIKKARYTDNVMDLIASKLKLLEKETKEALQIAAFLGNKFDLFTLAAVCKKPARKIFQDILPAIQEGVLIPGDPAYRYQSFYPDDTEKNIDFTFLHDRVQQAAYSLISEKSAGSIHLNIGRILLQRMEKENKLDNVIIVVNHYNHALEEVKDPDEKNRLIYFYNMAGTKSMLSAAYDFALTYFKSAMTLMNETYWETHYDSAIEIHNNALESAFAASDFEEMKRIDQIILKKAKNNIDKIKRYRMAITSLTKEGKNTESNQTGIEILRLLGIKIPEHPSQMQIVFLLMRLKLALIGKSMDDLYNAPDITDEKLKAVITILNATSASAYLSNTYLYVYTTLLITLLTVKHGFTPRSPGAYALYSIILCTDLHDIDRGAQFGQLAMRLLNRKNAEIAKAEVMMVFHGFVSEWTKPNAEAITGLKNTYAIALDLGDIENLGYSASICLVKYFFYGANLGKVIKKSEELEETAKKHGAEILKLTTKFCFDDANYLHDPDFHEKIEINQHLDMAKNSNMLMLFYAFKIFIDYYSKDDTYEFDYIPAGIQCFNSVRGFVPEPIFIFYSAMAYLKIWNNLPKVKKVTAERHVKFAIKRYEWWSKYSPEKFLNKYMLLRGEYDRIKGKTESAIEFLEQSMVVSKATTTCMNMALPMSCSQKYIL